MRNIQSQSPTPATADTPANATNPSIGCSNTGGKTWGYVRVSTREQNEARQLVALHDFGISQDCGYMDKQSGKDFNRPAYVQLLAQLHPGDDV